MTYRLLAATLCLLLAGCAGTSRLEYAEWRIGHLERAQEAQTRAIAAGMSPREIQSVMGAEKTLRAMDSLTRVGICRIHHRFIWECKYPTAEVIP